MTVRVDTASMRKNRGAFFTPPDLARFISNWAIRTADDTIVEPSCGDAIFLREAASSLVRAGAVRPSADQLVGFDIHQDSLDDAVKVLEEDGYEARLIALDFFDANPFGSASALIGNPPYIRFQGFSGRSREIAIQRAARAGVALSGLASSWAAFVVHGAAFLAPGGRMGLVLPAELLSVNYAGPVRRFLLENFASVDLVVFDELVFAGVQADVVVLLADGYSQGSSTHFRLHVAKDVGSMDLNTGSEWSPVNASDKWTDALAPNDAARLLGTVPASILQPLNGWGRIVSGSVTGANDFFTLTRREASELGLTDAELLPLLPAGTSLTSMASVSKGRWLQISENKKGYLFYPGQTLSLAAKTYVESGEFRLLNDRYKCRVRSPWWKVPLATRADLFVSYMSGSTPRIVGNQAGLVHLNSVHGLTAFAPLRALAQSVLPVVAMNSASLLSAEIVGRSYGGGVLKMEPTEAARWMVPTAVSMQSLKMSSLLARGRAMLEAGNLEGCSAIADQILLQVGAPLGLTAGTLHTLRETRIEMVRRRATRGTSKAP